MATIFILEAAQGLYLSMDILFIYFCKSSASAKKNIFMRFIISWQSIIPGSVLSEVAVMGRMDLEVLLLYENLFLCV